MRTTVSYRLCTEIVRTFLGCWGDYTYWECRHFRIGTLIFTGWLFFFLNRIILFLPARSISKSFIPYRLFFAFRLKSPGCFFLYVRSQGLANFRARIVNINMLDFAAYIGLCGIFWFLNNPLKM